MRHIVAVLLLASLGAASEDLPPRPYCRENSSCEFNTTPDNKEYYYKVTGLKVIVKYEAGISFHLKCDGNIPVNSFDLPAMKQPHEVEYVSISGCSAPWNASYAKALNEMNFTVTETLVLDDLPAKPTLKRDHLTDLRIKNLKIVGKSNGDPQRPTQNYLEGVRLRSLKLQNVIPEKEALMLFPNTLEDLVLEHTFLPTAESELGNGSAWLERLRSLRHLSLREWGVTEKLTVPKLELLPNLTNLYLHYIPLDSGNLAGKLKGSSIKHLVMRSCELNYLPNNLFEGANLTILDLSLNNLTLQEGVFSPLRWLTELDLEKSQVDSADLVNIVSCLPHLEHLKASQNPLGSLCGDADFFSKLPWPKSLRSLDLSETNITRICPDWIRNDALLDVNLSLNDIRYVNYQDLKMKRAVLGPTAQMTLDLTNNPNLRIINVSRVDILQCHNDFSSVDSNKRTQAKVKLILDNSLNDAQCDDDAYMLHEVMRNCPWLQFDKGIFKNLLSPSKADEIVCPYSGSGCLLVPECECKKRPRDNATVVRCLGALPRAPRWPAAAPKYPLALHVAPRTLDRVPRLTLLELHAPYNNITNLNEEDLPDTLLADLIKENKDQTLDVFSIEETELDVRYNNISHISEAVARKLNAIGTNRSVYLEGNQLACSCSDASALKLLKDVVRDLSKTQCADGTDVLQKIQTLSDMCAFPWVPILWSLSIVLVLLVVLLLLHRFKPQIRQVLFKLNWGRRFIFSVKDDDAEQTVDVFLSYAHRDLEVLIKLKNGLEARGYTTLEHNRDWQPGVPIIDQIAHSVKCARRTLLLVSDNYADSQWAVEEFRAAHAHAMKRQTTRVLVVRLQDNLHQPERLPPNLQLYLKYNTYLDWTDVKFWEKLCNAMPMHFEISN